MNLEFLRDLEQLLHEGKINKALYVLKLWLGSASPGDPQKLLEACSVRATPKVALLLRDLISRYPNIVVGCPVLIYAESELPGTYLELSSQEPLPPRESRLTLPAPPKEGNNPASDLTFLGWTSKDELLPNPLTRESKDCDIPWESMHAVIALFECAPEVFDRESIVIPPMWWGSLFADTPAHLRLGSRMVFSYPEAREAALVLEAAANNKATHSPLYFLGDEGLHWAIKEGTRFQGACLRQFPSMRE